MRVRYDATADAAYIYLAEPTHVSRFGHTYACDPVGTGGMINLDFDEQGVLIGIEVLDARSLLPAEVIEAASDGSSNDGGRLPPP